MNEIPFLPLVQVENAARTYLTTGGEVHALKGINLAVPFGAFIALKGRSGSGKTTLLNLVGGLDQPTSGEVYFDGQPLSALDDNARTDLRRERMGFVFQSFALLPTYSAFENVEFVLRLAGKGVGEARQRTVQCLKAVGLSNRMHNRPDELSGGQQQRVAIARAMANHPTLILADEPTGELDTGTTRQVLALLRRLVDHEGVTLLVTSHDPLIDEVADEVYLLKDGELAEDSF
ncbi:MAG: ABC transporter ATP-binding protein [Anaerolineaceae bacterium]